MTRLLVLLTLMICTKLYSGQMIDLEYNGKDDGKYPYGKFVVFNNKILTFMDSNLVTIYNDKVEILREDINEFYRFEYASPEKIFLLVDTAIILYDGNTWSSPEKMVYNIDNFRLDKYEKRTLVYDKLNDRLNIVLPSFYYLFYKNDSLFFHQINGEVRTEKIAHSSIIYNAEVFNGACYFLNGALTLSKLEYPNNITFYQKEKYMDLSRDLYPGNTITGAFRDLGDKLWIGTGDGLITFYDGTKFQKIDIMSNLINDDIYEKYYHIRDFNIDRDGNYWLAVEWISNNVWGDKSHQTIYKFNKSDNFKAYKFWQRTGFDKDDSDEFNYFKIELDENNLNNKKVYIKSQDGFMIYDPDATSVTENEIEEVIVSPQPVQDELRIEKIDLRINTEIEIYNILGEKILSVSTSGNFVATSAGGGQIRIDVSHLASGIYFIKIGDKVQKFVKE